MKTIIDLIKYTGIQLASFCEIKISVALLVELQGEDLLKIVVFSVCGAVETPKTTMKLSIGQEERFCGE